MFDCAEAQAFVKLACAVWIIGIYAESSLLHPEIPVLIEAKGNKGFSEATLAPG